MNSSGIFITADHIKSLSNDERLFLFSLIGGDQHPQAFRLDNAAQNGFTNNQSEDPHFVEFSPSQAREFYAGCNEKTRKAIEVIARSDDRHFQLADVAEAVGVTAPELKGVWSGLTRRSRTVTGDNDAYLIDWAKSEAIYDEDGNYSDQRGEVSEFTYRSFRKALGIS